MESIKFVKKYTKQQEFWYLLSSDLHIFHPDFDEKAFKADFDRALDLGARIFIAGDVMDLIVPGDKRFDASPMSLTSSNFLLTQVKEAVKILKPYVNAIDVIGVGNHEAVISKYHHIDPVWMLLMQLNMIRDVDKYGPIFAGGYEGAIWLSYRHQGKNNHVFSYDIFYNHGQGKSAEVTKGAIDLNRRYMGWMCDLVWLGHKHTKIADFGGGYIYRDSMGNLKYKKRTGIVTGCYLKPMVVTNSNESGYSYRFQDVKTRTLSAEGGMFMRHKVVNDKLEVDFVIS